MLFEHVHINKFSVKLRLLLKAFSYIFNFLYDIYYLFYYLYFLYYNFPLYIYFFCECIIIYLNN